jgi:hypothetical protein
MSDERQWPGPAGAADTGLGWLLDDLVARVEMAVLVKRVRQHLAVDPRAAATDGARA